MMLHQADVAFNAAGRRLQVMAASLHTRWELLEELSTKSPSTFVVKERIPRTAGIVNCVAQLVC